MNIQRVFYLGLCLGLCLVACGSQTTQSNAEPTVAQVATIITTNPTIVTTNTAVLNEVVVLATETVGVTKMLASSPTSPATPTTIIVETVAPPPSPTIPPDYLQEAGRLESGVFFLGNVDAPITLTDYSDFL